MAESYAVSLYLIIRWEGLVYTDLEIEKERMGVMQHVVVSLEQCSSLPRDQRDCI